MQSIAERIMMIVERNGNNKSDFARRINVTPAYISKLSKNPDSVPSERTILDICREFKVNEEWLRTGQGEMFRKLSRSDEIAAFFGDVLSGEPDFRARFIAALSRLNADQWKLLEQIADNLIEECAKKKTDQ